MIIIPGKVVNRGCPKTPVFGTSRTGPSARFPLPFELVPKNDVLKQPLLLQEKADTCQEK
jgi:hypothetical protein